MNEAFTLLLKEQCIIKRVVDPNWNDVAKVNQIAILDQIVSCPQWTLLQAQELTGFGEV